MQGAQLDAPALQVAGVGAKVFIALRINLEARRLLAHTALSIATIAGRLGFQEPTNFVQFFKRDVGCTPGECRRRQAEPDGAQRMRSRNGVAPQRPSGIVVTTWRRGITSAQILSCILRACRRRSRAPGPSTELPREPST